MGVPQATGIYHGDWRKNSKDVLLHKYSEMSAAAVVRFHFLIQYIEGIYRKTRASGVSGFPTRIAGKAFVKITKLGLEHEYK